MGALTRNQSLEKYLPEEDDVAAGETGGDGKACPEGAARAEPPPRAGQDGSASRRRCWNGWHRLEWFGDGAGPRGQFGYRFGQRSPGSVRPHEVTIGADAARPWASVSAPSRRYCLGGHPPSDGSVEGRSAAADDHILRCMTEGIGAKVPLASWELHLAKISDLRSQSCTDRGSQLFKLVRKHTTSRTVCILARVRA